MVLREVMPSLSGRAPFLGGSLGELEESRRSCKRSERLLSSRHCIDLFLDFVTLFRKLMLILAFNEKVSQPAACAGVRGSCQPLCGWKVWRRGLYTV